MFTKYITRNFLSKKFWRNKILFGKLGTFFWRNQLCLPKNNLTSWIIVVIFLFYKKCHRKLEKKELKIDKKLGFFFSFEKVRVGFSEIKQVKSEK